jgi:hypothetical protein
MNIPLIGAISIGGSAVSFLNADKFGAGAIWKKTGAFAGRNALGKKAASFKESGLARNL